MWDIIRANKRKSAYLIVLLAAVLLGLGYAAGSAFEPDGGGLVGLAAAAAVWIIMTLAGLTSGESILLASARAREVKHKDAPQLYNIVEEMQIASGLPETPRVFIIDSAAPNAFAVGLKPKRAAIAVTSGLLARLNRDELQGVVAHELGHIVNRDTLFMTLAGVTVGAVILIADLFVRGMFYSGGRTRRSSSKGGGQAAAVMMIVALVLAVIAPLLSQILYFACSRRREYLADASAAQYTRYPEGLASALAKISGKKHMKMDVSRALAPMFIVNPLAAQGGRAGLFSTHPSVEDRIRVLRNMVHGSSFAAYNEAFQSVHGGEGVLGAKPVRESPERGIRPAAEGGGEPQGWRAAKDIIHKINGLALVACACGARIKIPPEAGLQSVVCPHCNTQHDLSRDDLAAAAAVADAAGRRTLRKGAART